MATLALAIAAHVPAAAQCPDGRMTPLCQPVAPAPAMSVAVLTFQSRSRDTNDVFLAEGIADDIAARLGQVARIIVRSREAVRRLPNAEKMSMPDLGRRLNAAYVLSGTVQPSGGRLRVIVELTRAQSSDVAWTSPFDRTRDDILTMQTEIASAVASAVAGRLGVVDSRKVAASPTTNAEAFAHLIRGTAFMARRMHEYALPDLREAVRLDPTSALAWSRLSQSLAICNSNRCGLDSLIVLRRKAREAADRAITLDSSSADSWLADGLALVNTERPDLPAARASLERAVRIDPRSAEAHHVLGFLLLQLGENAAAMREYRTALAIDPGRAVTWTHLSFVAFDEGRFRDEEALADTALSLQKDFAGALDYKWTAVMHQGNASRIRGLSTSMGATDSTRVMFEEAYARLAEHDTVGASAMVDRLRAAGQASMPTVALLARTGRRQEAADLLRNREPLVASWHALRSKAYDVLRGIPEFDAYVARARDRALWTARPK